jgi:hypothetical protein
MRHPLILRPTLALAAAFLVCSTSQAIADPNPHVLQGHLPGSHANVRQHGHTPFNATMPLHEEPAPVRASDSDDFDEAAAGIAGGAAFVLGAALSSLLVIRQRPRPAS